MTTLKIMPPDAVFPLVRRLFRLAYRPVAWYSNREEGSDPLSGISGPGTGVTESGEFPCRDERSDVCLHWNPPSRGPDAVFGGKRFPVTGIPGGMHDMERFLAYAFFYVLMPYLKIIVRFLSGSVMATPFLRFPAANRVR